MSLGPTWRKSTRSGDNGNCVEARHPDATVDVRDSKTPAGAILTFAPARWATFTDGIRHGDFHR